MQEVLEKRTRNGKVHSLGGGKFSFDGRTGAIHYWDNGWQGIDTELVPALAPWDWEMAKAGYHVRVKEDFTAGQVIELSKAGENVTLQPMALEWTNDLDQIQSISMPQSTAAVVTNPILDLLPTVGLPCHTGTIRWENAYGPGLDFQWMTAPSRLVKILSIDSFSSLPTPAQYIIDGGDPVLRLNLIFDPSNGVDIEINGAVWNKKDKTVTFNIIEFKKNGEILWGFMPLRYWGSGEGDTNEGISVATVEKRGNSLCISIRVPLTWLQSAVYPVLVDVDIDEEVLVGADDGFSREGGLFFPAESTVRVGEDGTGICNAWFRWPGVNIPQLSTIDVANYSVFGQNQATDPLTNIYLNDVAGPTAPANEPGHAAKVRTTAFIAWDERFDANRYWVSPEIKTVVQEVVNAFTTTAIMILQDDDGSPGGDWQKSLSVENGTSEGALLHIEYTLAGGTPAGALSGGAGAVTGAGAIRLLL